MLKFRNVQNQFFVEVSCFGELLFQMKGIGDILSLTRVKENTQLEYDKTSILFYVHKSKGKNGSFLFKE